MVDMDTLTIMSLVAAFIIAFFFAVAAWADKTAEVQLRRAF